MRRIAFAALLLTLAAPAHAQPPALAELAFLAGCWSGDGLEEHYTTPTTNVILGLSRYVQGGATRQFEFSRITRTDAAVTLTPQPDGGAGTPFRLTAHTDSSVTFENPAHDFPQRIRYHREGETLTARIESLDGQGREWRMRRIPCVP